MANETGLDILRTARRAYPQLQYESVLVTGDTTSDLYQIAHDEGIHILHKPMRPNRLRSYLNNLMSMTNAV